MNRFFEVAESPTDETGGLYVSSPLLSQSVRPSVRPSSRCPSTLFSTTLSRPLRFEFGTQYINLP